MPDPLNPTPDDIANNMDDQPAAQLQAKKGQSLADELTAARIGPIGKKGQLIGFRKFDDSEGDVELPLSTFGVTEGFLHDHPEGSDRGGYIWHALRGNEVAIYQDGDGSWQIPDFPPKF